MRNIPIGNVYSELSSASALVDDSANPMAAGMMVEGIAPITPPNTGPSFSMAKVTPTAVHDANSPLSTTVNAPGIVLAITMVCFFTTIIANMGGEGIRTTLTLLAASVLIHIAMVLAVVL